MYKNLKKRTEGFTIIEVLIVLAIAGLIMLIVFLAVPALQRNSRNNGRRNDVSRMAAAVNDFVTNRNGNLPTTAEFGTIVTNLGNMSQFTTGDRVASATGGVAVLGSTANQQRYRLVTLASCTTTGDGTTTPSGTTRKAAIQYQLETNNSSSHTNVCLDI